MRIGKITYKTWEDRIFLIDYDFQTPLTFYKFYALSENSVDAITTPYLYATHSSLLNDTFDCYKDIIEFDDKEIAQKAWNLIGKGNDIRGNPELFNETPWAFSMLMFRKLGVFSMTSRPTDELMWAHYAGKEGFCVELDISKLRFQDKCRFFVYPINYQKKIERFKVSETDLFIALAIQCSVKRAMWKYEKEWRLLVQCPDWHDMKTVGWGESRFNNETEHNRKYKYSVNAIKRFVFRQDFFETEERELMDGRVWKIFINNVRKQKLLDFIISNHIPVYIQCILSYGEYKLRKIRMIKNICGNEYRIWE